jgi:hypothetical protein
MSQTLPTYPSEPTNASRAEWARHAVMAFASLTGQGVEESYLDDPECARGWLLEVGGDLLADLFHLADQMGVEPAELVERGYFHHDAEVVEDE